MRHLWRSFCSGRMPWICGGGGRSQARECQLYGRCIIGIGISVLWPWLCNGDHSRSVVLFLFYSHFHYATPLLSLVIDCDCNSPASVLLLSFIVHAVSVRIRLPITTTTTTTNCKKMLLRYMAYCSADVWLKHHHTQP